MNQPSSKNRFIRPLLIGIIGFTLLSGGTIFFTFTRGLYKPPSLPDAPIVIEQATIFDGDSVLTGHPKVVIEDGVITCLGEDCEVPTGAEIIDASGLSLMPGLIDGYLRFYSPTEENLSQGGLSGFLSFVKQRPQVRKNLIQAGVTTVFSAGDLPQNILLLKDQQSKWDLAGPRIVATGPDFTAPEGYPLTIYAGNEALEKEGVRTQTDPAAAQQEAAKLLSYGVDAVKIVYDDLGGKLPKINTDILRGLIEVANQNGSFAVVRCGNEQDLQEASKLGARILAFGPATSLDSSTINALFQADITYFPLLSSRSRADRPRLRENLVAMRSRGVKVGIGSMPRGEKARFGESLHQEMLALQEVGFPPAEILQMATHQAAVAIKVDDQVGNIAPGKQADLILLQGKPWEDLSAFKDIQQVMLGGRFMLEPNSSQ